MASPAVHNKEGKLCKHCKKQFTSACFNITVSHRQKGYIIKETVCGECYHKHMSKGE